MYGREEVVDRDVGEPDRSPGEPALPVGLADESDGLDRTASVVVQQLPHLREHAGDHGGTERLGQAEGRAGEEGEVQAGEDVGPGPEELAQLGLDHSKGVLDEHEVPKVRRAL